MTALSLPISHELLSRFSQPEDPREFVCAPFQHSMGIVATDGCILIALAGCGNPKYREVKRPPRIELMLDASWAKIWRTASTIEFDRTWHTPCPACQASGFLSIVECADCKGAGSHLIGTHVYECAECDGTGKTEAPATLLEGSERIPCDQCTDGFFDRIVPVRVGCAFFQAKYIDLIQELPECQIAVRSPTESAALRFDGGIGALMPMRV